MPRFGVSAKDEKVLEFAQVRNRRLPTPTGTGAFTPSACSGSQELRDIFLVRLQLLHNQFAEVSNSVMIRMLLGTMQEKLVDSQVTGFELENTLVA